MSYIHKLINDDEKLVGIARLHWIYIVQGLMWFFALAGSGFLMSWLMNRGMAAMMRMTDEPFVPAPMLSLSNGVTLFMLVTGAIIFLLYVVKVIATSIAITDRRVIHKHGLIFVHAHHIDLEEIRGENLDLGYLGRILGYGYVMLDCRFIGDIKLPAIENPEVFLRALHDRRAHAQDTLNLIAGKAGTQTPINIVSPAAVEGEPVQPQQPEVAPPKPPEPEVAPTQPDQIPTPPNQPMPNAPPPLDKKQAKQTQSNTLEKMKPEIERRVEKVKQELKDDLVLKQSSEDRMVAPKSLEDVRAENGKEPELNMHQTQRQTQLEQPDVSPQEQQQQQAAQEQQQHQQAQQEQAQPQQQQAAPAPEKKPVMDKEQIAKVVEEITPQIAQEVVKEMAREGLIKPAQPAQNDNEIDNDLVKDFDEAAFKDRPHDDDPRLEHAIH